MNEQEQIASGEHDLRDRLREAFHEILDDPETVRRVDALFEERHRSLVDSHAEASSILDALRAVVERLVDCGQSGRAFDQAVVRAMEGEHWLAQHVRILGDMVEEAERISQLDESEKRAAYERAVASVEI